MSVGSSCSNCRLCRSETYPLIDLGNIYPSDFAVDWSDADLASLALMRCSSCKLVQLKSTLPADRMYRTYWYRSGLNPSMVESLKDVVRSVKERVCVGTNDVVVDIGANDGTLLRLYQPKPITLGFDPAINLADDARKACNIFVNDYFSAARYPIAQKAKVITSIAMFYDLEDPCSFVEDITQILADDGIWVVQLTDLLSMLKLRAFDNICMEHIEYYSLEVLQKLFKRYNLDIFDVEYNEVNGGSIRVYACFAGTRPISARVFQNLQAERETLEQQLVAFKGNVEAVKESLSTFIKHEVSQGKRIFALGASTKGNTLLQYCSLNHDLISYAAEINSDKFGKFTVGTNIPIIPEVDAFAQQPDYFLVLPWHFISGFVERNRAYLERGGKFIVPLPTPALVDKMGWTYLQIRPQFPAIAQKSLGFMLDELITTCIKYRHWTNQAPHSETELAHLGQRKQALEQAIEQRLHSANLDILQNADLIAELTQTLVDCWDKQEIIMREDDPVIVAKSAKDCHKLNAQRNKLVRALDANFGETAISVTSKTYA